MLRWSFRLRFLSGLPVFFGIAACSPHGSDTSAPDLELRDSSSAISQSDNQVLEFENLGDWRSDTGATLSSVTGFSGKGLQVAGTAYRRVLSRPMSSLGSIRSTVTIRVRPSVSQPYWQNTVELIVRAPSQGLYYQPLGTKNVSGAGSFQQVSFDIPPAIKTKLEASYSDLEVLVALNGPGTFTIDQVDFGATVGGSTPPPPPPGPGTVQTFELKIPRGLDVESTPLLAADGITLFSNVEVVKESGAWAGLSNAGSTETGFEPDVKVGPVTSVARVRLSDRDEIYGDIVTRGLIDSAGKTGIVREGLDRPNQPVPIDTLPFQVEFPTSLTRTTELQNGANGSEQPGGFARLWIYSGSTLSVGSGRYSIDDFGLEPGAKIVVDDSSGPVQFDVRDQFLFHGAIERKGGGFPNFALNYVGSQPLVIESPFAGRLTAPLTSVELATVSEPHRGWFYGNKIIVRPNTKVVHHPVSSLIGTVTISNRKPCAGEAFTVEVGLPPHVPPDAASISIQGVPTNKRIFVFDGYPGPRFFVVTVSYGGIIQSQQFEIELKNCEVPTALLEAAPSYDDERVWDLWLEELPAGGARTFEWSFGDGQSAVTQVPLARHSYAGAIQPQATSTNVEVQVTVREGTDPPIVIRRTLSLGSIYALNRARGTISPHVRVRGLEPTGTNWDVAVTLANVEQEALSVAPAAVDYYSCGNTPPDHRPLSVPATAVAAAESRELVVTIPKPVDPSQVCALAVHLSGTTASGKPVRTSAYHSVVGRRPSAAGIPLTDPELTAALNAAATQGLFSDPNLVAEEELLRLRREGTMFELSELPPDSVGNFTQMLSAGEPCTPGSGDQDGFFCAPTDRWVVLPGEIINAQKGDVLMSPSCSGIVGTMLANLQPTQFYSHVGIMSQDRVSVFSATTPEDRGKEFPNDGDNPRFPGDGFEEQVLKFGWPGGIDQSINEALFGGYYTDPVMKTFAMGPFQSKVRRCDDGGTIRNISPAVLKPPPAFDSQVRPTLHELADETMSAAVPTHYRFFSYTDATIATQRDAAGNFIHLARGPFQSHTAWAEGTLPVVCSTVIWAAAHRLQERGAEFVLEGTTLEDIDLEIRDGAKNGTEDGLYFYPESERRAAAIGFYDNLFKKVSSKDSTGLGEFFSDIADDIATQSTMCFAKDRCDQDAKDADREEWENPGDGNTVSPDNMMLWDSPEEGGLYGYMERMMYVGARVRRQFEWQPIASAASLSVTVVNESDGEVREGATVVLGDVLAGNKRSLMTDASGRVRFENLGVASGGSRYPVTAGFVVPEPNGSDFTNQVYLFGEAAIDIPDVAAGQTPAQACPTNGEKINCCEVVGPTAACFVRVALEGGDPNYRRANIRGKLEIIDDDGGDPGEHEKGHWDNLYIEQELGPEEPSRSNTLGGYCVDGEVEGKLEINTVYVDQAALQALRVTVANTVVPLAGDEPVGTLVTHFKARIWEDAADIFSNDCDVESDDEETPDSEIVIVRPGAKVTVRQLRALNAGYGDKVIFDMEIENVGQFGSFPMPAPSDQQPNLDPKRRLIVVNADHKLHDGDEILNSDEEAEGKSEVSVAVDPWNRIAENTATACVDDEVVGGLKIRARLLEDLESVEVTVFAQVSEGDSCGDADFCGETIATVDVPRDETRTLPDMTTQCFWLPLLNDDDSSASFSGITIANTQNPTPAP